MSGPPKKSLFDILMYVLILIVGALWSSASSETRANTKDIVALKEQFASIAQKVENIDKRTERMENKVDKILEKGR